MLSPFDVVHFHFARGSRALYCRIGLLFAMVRPWYDFQGPLVPLHTQSKSRDHEIVRAQNKVSKGLSEVISKIM